MPVTISTKGVDWPYSAEALQVVGSPCFLCSFLFLSPFMLCLIFSKPITV